MGASNEHRRGTVDMSALDDATPPAATVAARTGAGNWMVVPGSFPVVEGETLRELLGREGGRRWPILRPASWSASTSSTRPLVRTRRRRSRRWPTRSPRSKANGSTYPASRVVRSQLDELIDSKGVEELDAEHAGSPAAAHDLPATALRGIGEESAVGKTIADTSIGDIAAEPRSTSSLR